MGHDRTAALAWADRGTALCATALAGLSEEEYASPSALPGWTRKHLVAHLAANAEALGNLVRWAHTGEPTPMYASPEARAEGIAQGPRLSGAELTRWFTDSAAQLAAAMAALSESAWRAEVVTAQGRTVPAEETPYLRAREVLVHAVDLATGLTFADLPADFLRELEADIRARRGPGAVPEVAGARADVVAYLAGRSPSGPVTADGGPPADLPPWL
ncbi:maleylpyruvate isomerase family mycothiol-dependent enzyme [Streptomyces catenulae]|uniref:Maleylpyruvate isomerase family mycothiol-dependent enzyme n=1 Tax=Streptomyces catenulae TaxID=66875 RepID=A0ABV2YZM3_9ACTN|nr:maleylpyruvate isomerase family mycothiol-dependent enzyme [Streptomyces catenulae]